jgi:nicotinate-nucleotide adenylyltransferase
MNVGLFGGTFNPFHNGHIGIISHIKEQFDLDNIILIPSSTPPHKKTSNLAPQSDRYEMVRQSIAGLDGFALSDKEIVRKGPSFTIDTLHEFKSELNSSTRLHLLMGSDAFLDILTWKDAKKIFDLISIIVMLRGNWKKTDQISEFINENISKHYVHEPAMSTYNHPTKQSISICRVPKIDISSTMIRNRLKQDQPISNLVPEPVERIIREKELYK